jgi:hypothetical protein
MNKPTALPLATLSIVLLAACTIPPSPTEPTLPSTGTPVASPYITTPSPLPLTPPPAAILLTPSSAAGLTIEEHPFTADTIGPGFDLVDRVPSSALARREEWRQPVPHCVPGLYDCPPQIIGEHAYTIELVDVLHYNVREDGEIIYSLTATETPPDPGAHIALLDWQGQWVLEFDNQVIINGASLNEQLGYDHIFNWRIVHGQPFYFFVQDEQVDVSYGGETLPQTYVEVVHNLCCEPFVCNVQTYADMVAFYARKGDIWFYVEMGVYD